MTIKTTAQLHTEINTNFPDNTSGLITPALLRTTTTDIVDTYAGAFNVKAYGAVGNGVADDTAAINSAIVDLNAAGRGRLYFPAGTYLVSSSLTAITASAIIQGDGMNWTIPGIVQGTLINYTSNNSSLFTMNSGGALRDMYLNYTGVSTPVAGSAGITVTNASSNAFQKVDYDSIEVVGFYINIDIQVGAEWSAHNIHIYNAVFVGVHVQNIFNHDAGDWAITNSYFSNTNVAYVCGAGIYVQSSGGGKITNCKFNALSSPNGMNNGIGVDFTSAATSDMNISNCSFENLGGNTNGAAISFSGVNNGVITGCAFDLNAQYGIILQLVCPNCVVVGNLLSNGLAIGDSTTPTTLTYAGNGGIVGTPVVNFLPAIGWVYTQPSSTEARFAWQSAPTRSPELEVQAPDTGTTAIIRCKDSAADIGMQMKADATGGSGSIGAATTTSVVSDAQVASGGTHPISFKAGGTNSGQEVFQAISAGLLKFTNAANFTANGATAASLGSTSPGHGTVQKWLTVQDSGGSTFYIPCF